jgi:hypothetical protein
MNRIDSQEMYGMDQAIAITNRGMWQFYHDRAEDGLVEVARYCRVIRYKIHAVESWMSWSAA